MYPKKCSRQHQKDAGLKRAQTSTTVASKSIPSSEQAVDIPGESDGDAPGANEEEEEFECNDVQFAKSVRESKRACGAQDIETVFTEVVDEDGKKFWTCQVCK